LRDLTDFCTRTQKTWLAMRARLCFVPLEQNHVLWHSEHAWLSKIVGGRGTERERERLDLGATMKRELRTHTPCKARGDRFHPFSCHLA
jgi:hypothetical protein